MQIIQRRFIQIDQARIVAFERLPCLVQGQALSQAVAEPDGALEEIIVTARRRAESLGDAPVAVSAFSAEQLARRNIQSTQDLDCITPSLQFATSGQLSGNNSAAVVFIRGVGQIDPTPAVDPEVGIYMKAASPRASGNATAT